MLSRVPTGEHEIRVGIHISAPALGIEAGSALDAIARERLSSAYFPGQKYTMLPPDWISAFSLDAGCDRPVVSLYLDVSTRDFSIRARHSRLERVPVAANLRHPELEPLNRAFVAGQQVGVAFEEELRLLWQFSEARERGARQAERGRGGIRLCVSGRRRAGADRAQDARRDHSTSSSPS
jgi:exoribonuclease-2